MTGAACWWRPSARLPVGRAGPRRRAGGRDGEVVLASVVVVPHAQPLEATLDRAVGDACAVLDQGERAAAGAGAFDTRLLRARSFSEGVLDAAAAERLRRDRPRGRPGTPCNGARAQIEAVMERAESTRRPRPPRPRRTRRAPGRYSLRQPALV